MNLRATLLIIFHMMIPLAGWAGTEVGNAAYVKGEVTVLRLSEPAPKPISLNDPVYPMDTLQTGEGELKVLFNDNTLLSLSPNSKVLITEHVYRPNQGERRSIYDILKGKVRTIVDQALSLKTNDVTLQTPTAVAGIRGTDVGTIVRGSSTQFLCFSGRFEAYFRNNPTRRVQVGAGQLTTISGPVPPQPVPIPKNIERQFSSQLEAPSLREVLRQSEPPPQQQGAQGTGRMPPPAPPAPPPPPLQPAPAGSGTAMPLLPPRPPMPPPILPGGEPFTPPEVPTGTSGTTTGGGTTSDGGTTGSQSGPVKVPIKLPGE